MHSVTARHAKVRGCTTSTCARFTLADLPEKSVCRPTVLYVINAFNRGGAEKGLVHLTRMGAFAGFDLRIVSLIEGEGAYVADLEFLGATVEIFRKSAAMRMSDWLLALPKLTREIKRLQPKVVILSLPQANIAGRLVSLFFPRMVVASFEHNTHLSKKLYELFFRLTSRRVDWLIADSTATADVVSRRLYMSVPDARTILPLVSFEPSKPPPETGEAPNPFTIANAGRFTKVKNQAVLIEALSVLAHRGHKVRLVLYGEGKEASRCKQLADRLGVSEFVEFPGFRQDWADQPADVFVLPSLNEGLCIVALEAMSRGIPVIATKVGGLQDYGPPAKSLLLPSARVDLVADAVESLIRDEALRNSMRKAGLQMVLERYSHDRVTEDYAAFNRALRDRTR